MSEDQKITISLDEAELTIGDMEIIEEVAGSLGEGLSELSETKMTLALVLIALRKDDPEATLQDARGVKITSLTHLNEEASAEVDPTN